MISLSQLIKIKHEKNLIENKIKKQSLFMTKIENKINYKVNLHQHQTKENEIQKFNCTELNKQIFAKHRAQSAQPHSSIFNNQQTNEFLKQKLIEAQGIMERENEIARRAAQLSVKKRIEKSEQLIKLQQIQDQNKKRALSQRNSIRIPLTILKTEENELGRLKQKLIVRKRFGIE